MKYVLVPHPESPCIIVSGSYWRNNVSMRGNFESGLVEAKPKRYIHLRSAMKELCMSTSSISGKEMAKI